MMPIIVRMSTPNKKIFMLLAIMISLTGALGSTASGEGGPRATTRCKEAERHALLEIKENLNGSDVGFLSSWGNGDERRECCEWVGIRCDNKSGHVIRLDISPSTHDAPRFRDLEGLSQISGLSTLDLSNNSLSGKIPTGTQLQTRDATAYFGNPKLCGDPLSKKCPGEDEPTTSRATKDHGDDQDNEDLLITKGFYISGAVGFIVAFWGFCLALIFNKSWRYIYLKSLNKAEDWVYVTVAVNKAKLLRIIKS